MKKVFIKYNPYKLETEITVDGKKLAQNSKLGEKIFGDFHLQEWVEEAPRILIDEYNDTDFDITFHGTLLDYEDLTDVFSESIKRKELTAKFEHIPAKETTDKEPLIENVFKEIQEGPFDELQGKEILAAFEHAKSHDFEVCVVATMSAGKSTLVNAMLGAKLMPSKQEACTAIITRIKDTSQDSVPFKAKVYHKDDHLAETHERLTYPIMERLNSDENVSVIEVSGNIPFVKSDDVSLVLIDTPGPNNSRDPRHRKVQSELLGKSSKALVLYIMTGEFGTDDDNALLKRVAESMAVGGKQSKDRFIFVVNKLDDRKAEDGDTGKTLESVRSYLERHGIANPNLFPAAALPALNLRLIENGALTDEDEIDETEVKIKKLNRNAPLHFETYAALPPSLRGEIAGLLDEARSIWGSKDGRDNENPAEALIHSGVVSIEAAIRQYVQKYAKTVKIKNIVDTFMHKLEEVGCFEKTKKELAENKDDSAKIVKRIDSIREKMNSGVEAKKFKDAVDDAVVKINDDAKKTVKGIIKKYQIIIDERISGLVEKEFDVDYAEEEVLRLREFTRKLEPDFEVELDELIRNNLVTTSISLLDQYKAKLASLSEEIDIKNITGVGIEPLKFMGGSAEASCFSIKHLVEEEERIDRVERYTEKVRTRGWFESWKFWPNDEDVERTRNIFKTVKYVKGDKLAQEFFSPVQQGLFGNRDAACAHALKQSKRIAERFNEEFARLDDTLKAKLTELESCVTERDKADERIKESKRKLDWLETIQAEVKSILEI